MKRLLIAGALAFGLVAASPGSAGAWAVYCDWDPPVAIITPGGHLVLVYDSVWTSNALTLALPLETYTATRAYDAHGRPVTAVDMAISTPTGLLLNYSTMDEVTSGLLGGGALLARAYGTSGQTTHLKFTIPES